MKNVSFPVDFFSSISLNSVNVFVQTRCVYNTCSLTETDIYFKLSCK